MFKTILNPELSGYGDELKSDETEVIFHNTQQNSKY